jgi:hypothetical protein
MRFSIALVLACSVLVALAVTGDAGPRKVLVLPVDGNADAPVRTRLDAVVLRLAHTIDGDVKVGATTFADDALVAGCDPAMVSCVDTVIGTLGVDELVWGTATTENGTTTVVIKRATKGTTPKDVTATLSPTDVPEKAEDSIKPMFVPDAAGSGSAAGSAAIGSGSGSGSAEPVQPWSQDKKLGVGLAAGGGLSLAIGFALWANESSLQGQINSAPIATLANIQSLKALEDKAGTYATWGDIMVIVGLAAGGAGAYYLWKDHQNQASVTITPAPVDNGTGARLIVGGRW